MIRLSKRLQSVASLAGACDTLADVGTDHGYIPIYLVGSKQVRRAIAMDINPGPLQHAREHIRQYGLEASIETRLSDGLFALRPGEADKIIIAGMGGGLMMRILAQGQAAARVAESLVLQPQSEVAAFRAFLWENGYGITAEDMVCEDGKYYPMISAKYVGEEGMKPLGELACKYGPMLLEQKHPVLREYLEWQRGIKKGILQSLRAKGKGVAGERVLELEQELEGIEEALRKVYG